MENNKELSKSLQESNVYTEDKEKTAEEWFDLGSDLWIEDFQKCVFCLENAIRLGLSDTRRELYARAILGNIYNQKLERYSDAIREYEKALEIDDKEFDSKYLSSVGIPPGDNNKWENFKEMIVGELADCYGMEASRLLHDNNDLDKAIEYSKKGLDIDKTSKVCRTVLGNSYWGRKNWNDVIETYNKLDIESLKSDVQLIIIKQLIDAYKNIGDYHSTLEYLDKLLILDPENERARNDKETCAKIIEDPTDEWIKRGKFLAAKGKLNDAIEHFDRAIKFNNNVSGLFYKGEALHFLERYEDSIIWFDKVLEIEPLCAKAWLNKGRDLNILTRYKESIECCNKAAELDQNLEIESLRLNGLAFHWLNNEEESEKCFKKALDLDPNNRDVLASIGTALHSSGKYSDALEYFDKALIIDPENARIIKLRNGTLEKMQGTEEYELLKKAHESAKIEDYRNAIEYFDRAIILNPKNPEPLYYKGMILSIMKRHREALECYNKVIEIDPKYENVQHKRDEKIREIEGEDIIKSKNTESGLYWYTLAENMLEKDKKDIDTLIAFENALKFGGLTPYEDVRSNANLAMLYGGRDRKEEMKICIKRVLELNDKYDDILRKNDSRLYAGMCRFYARDVSRENDDPDKIIKLLETPIELGYKDLYDYFDYRMLGDLYSKSAKTNTDINIKIYKLEKSIDYLEMSKDTADWDNWKQAMRDMIRDRRDEIYRLKHPDQAQQDVKKQKITTISGKNKNPGIAAILSAILIGLGQLYNGQVGKGVVMFIAAIILSMAFFPLALLFYIYNIYDAYTTAKNSKN